MVVAICAVAALLISGVSRRRPSARAPKRSRAARAERLQALQREADRLASQERTLLGDLRKLEIERQIKSEELKQVTRTRSKRCRPSSTPTAARIAALAGGRTLPSGRSCARALVEIYKLGQARYLRLLLATRRSAAARTVVAHRRGAGQARSRSRSRRTQRTLDELKETRKSLEAQRTSSTRVRARAAEERKPPPQRAAQARNDLIRDIDRRRDLNAQLSGELQAAQQKLQAALRDLGGRRCAGRRRR